MRGLISQFGAWVEHRTGLQTAISTFFFEDIPASVGWPEVFGSVALFLFLIQGLTGVLLALNYAPTPGDAYTSVTYIAQQVAGGRMIRGLHHWGASLMVIVVFLHMAQVFIFGAFKRPREATWIAGVVLFLLTLAFGLTGYLLPWDNKAYWGTVVTTQIAATLPVAGPLLTRLMGAANGLGSITFSRFYTLHTLLLPTATAGLIIIHVYLVRRHGISPRQFTEGRQKFYPKQVFRDLCAVFIAFLCLFLAACFLNVPLERMADPTDTAYVPRPEWYFLFLFQLLKIFPGRFELIGTLVLPSLAILLLILLPFLHRAHAKILKGRIQSASVAALVFSVWLGLTSAAGWTAPHAQKKATVPAGATEWARIPPEVIAGAGYFRSLHCDSCHNLLIGTPKPGPTLGFAGMQHPRDWLLQHFTDQSQAPPEGIGMPQRNALLIFVADVKPDSLQTLSTISPDFMVGVQTFVGSACASCHKVNGVGGDIGPSLNGLADRRSESWVRTHFASPRKLSPGSIMPPYHFTQREEQNLIDYLFSLPD